MSVAFPINSQFAAEGDQIVTRKSLLSEAVQTGELSTLFAETFTLDKVREIAEAIVGTPGAVLEDIDARIQAMLGGITSTADELRELIEGVVGTGATVDQVVGFILSLGGGLSQLGRIPASLIMAGSPNLLANGSFDGAVSLDGETVWAWDGAEGRSSHGSARTAGDGTRKVLTSNLVEVSSGEDFAVEGFVKWADVTAGAGTSFEIAVVAYMGDSLVSRTVVDTVSDLAYASSGSWIRLDGSYEVPASGVDGVRIQIAVSATVSVGSVWWDDLSLKREGGIAQALVDGLGSALSGLQSLTAGLQATLNQFQDIFTGVIVTPVNAIVQAVKDWWNQWFGGGSSNAIPLSQKGAANGVAPLNGSSKLATSYLQTNVANGVPQLDASGKVSTSLLVTDAASGVPTLDGSGKLKTAQLPALDYIPTSAKGAALGVAPLNSGGVVPLANLPSEVGGSGGTGSGNPYVILYLEDFKSIPNATPTLLSGFKQMGTTSVIFENSTNTRWKFTTSGMWQIQPMVRWEQNSTGYRRMELRKDYTGTYSGSTTTSTISALQSGVAANSRYDWSITAGSVMMSESVVWRTDYSYSSYGVDITNSINDYWGLRVTHNAGSAIQALSAGAGQIGDDTMLICTYLGAG